MGTTGPSRSGGARSQGHPGVPRPVLLETTCSLHTQSSWGPARVCPSLGSSFPIWQRTLVSDAACWPRLVCGKVAPHVRPQRGQVGDSVGTCPILVLRPKRRQEWALAVRLPSAKSGMPQAVEAITQPAGAGHCLPLSPSGCVSVCISGRVEWGSPPPSQLQGQGPALHQKPCSHPSCQAAGH